MSLLTITTESGTTHTCDTDGTFDVFVDGVQLASVQIGSPEGFNAACWWVAVVVDVARALKAQDRVALRYAPPRVGT